MQGKVLVISGPSGVGKSSIIRWILKECPNSSLLVSATTRAPRPGEKDGVNYHFLSKEEFEAYLKGGEIPEYRYTPETGNYYGTFLPDLREKLKAGKLAIADVDIIGAKFLKENFDALTVFILPPSKDALLSRIKKRKDNMPEAELQERLKIAEREISEDSKFYDFKVINEENKLKETVEKILDFIKKTDLPCQNTTLRGSTS